jgi:hypothetical protein
MALIGDSPDELWDPNYKAIDDSYVTLQNLCATSKEMGAYTAYDIMDSIQLLYLTWAETRPCDELTRYIQRLVIRASYIVSRVDMGDADCLLDVPEYRADIQSDVTVRIGTTQLLRYFAGPLNRMRAIVEFVLRSRTAYAHAAIENGEEGLKEMVKNVRKMICDSAETIVTITAVRVEIFDTVGMINVQFGEVEDFAAENDTEPPTPRSLACACKPTDVQHATSYVARAIDLELVATTMLEDTPGYAETYPIIIRQYALVTKLLIVDSLFCHHHISI